MTRKFSSILLLLLPLLWPFGAGSQTLKESAQQAVLTNPEIQSRIHAFEAADSERDVAFGAFLPRLDLSAGIGRDKYERPIQSDLNRHSTTVTLTQLIYDGFATSNEVDRLDYARRVRLYELYDITETTTLEVVRAYADVLRYRALVTLSEENYVRHRSVFEQIQRKTAAGVGRRVDSEQAAGRLALAESNLLVDTSNLHDVSARFQRLVGTPPRAGMEMPAGLNKGIPSDVSAALKAAQRHPALLAATENVRSANSSAKVRNAAFQPRFDFRLRSEQGSNLTNSTGTAGDSRSDSAEVVMTWNLFNGFSDRSRVRQYADQINVARDQRDKVCRDLRQTLAIAFNDTNKLTEQLAYLDQHQLSIEKARDAYRKQFDIGQRSLLDVLDTENELFQAKRSYVNSEYDLGIAYARSHAGMGNLFASLGLARPTTSTLPTLAEKNAEAPHGCPPEGPGAYVVDKDALNARAQQLVRESMPAAQEADPVTSAQQPTVAASDMKAAPPGAMAATKISPEESVATALKDWSAAWSGRDVSKYLSAYSANFKPAGDMTHSTWIAQRKAVLAAAQRIDVRISKIQIDAKNTRKATSTFLQSYRSATYQDTVQKTLEWESVDGRWLIVREASQPVVQ